MIKTLKRILFPGRGRFDRAEARVRSLEKQVESLQEQIRDVTSTLPGFVDVFLPLIAPLEPHRALGFSKRRVGSETDGGYVMLDDFQGISAAYSLGIGKEVSWDLAIAARNIAVHQFDHSIAETPVPHPLIQFHRLRVLGEDNGQPGTITLKNILPPDRATGHALLKMDIEGAEWEVFDSMPPEIPGLFRQILVEFHGCNHYHNPAWRERAARVFQKITTTHHLIHVHGNNYMPTFSAGVREFPCDLEMTFALKSAYDFSVSDEKFPGPLDRPCKPGLPDLDLGDFRF